MTLMYIILELILYSFVKLYLLTARMLAEHLIIFDNEKDRVGFMALHKCQFNKKRNFESELSPKHICKNDY